MKRKTIILCMIMVAAGAMGAGYYFLFSRSDNAGNTVADNAFGWKFPVVKFPITGPGEVAYSDIRDPGGIPQGLPVRLKVPIIGVDAAIEDALITPDGRMDVPAGSKNVAWFALGPHPGQVGSAVIGGHFGIQNGVPFVFYKLDTLKIGDKIYIVDDEGNTSAFQVRFIKLFDRNADATTVFTSNDGLAHLNLITCEGVWNQVNGTYPERRVVFADAIPSEGAIIVPPAPVVTTPARSLSIGMRGADVVALQTILVQKRFLKLPAGYAKGYFGTLTRAAVAKYQTSVGLPSNGVYGPSTRASLTPVVITEPTLPSTAITPEPTPTPTPSPSNVFTQSVKSLSGTPLDTLITSLLIIGIIFVGFKLIRL